MAEDAVEWLRLRGMVVYSVMELSRSVDAGHAQEHHGGQNRGQEDDAGDERAEAQATFGAVGGEEVADVRAERAGEDVGQPERQDRSHAGAPCHEDGEDQAGDGLVGREWRGAEGQGLGGDVDGLGVGLRDG